MKRTILNIYEKIINIIGIAVFLIMIYTLLSNLIQYGFSKGFTLLTP